MPPPPMLLVATETEPQLALSGDGGGGDAAAGELGLPHSLLSNPFLSPRCAAAACRQIAAQHQLPSQLGAFPWAANNGQTGLPLWAFYISGFNSYNAGLQVGFRAVQVPATGGCGYLTLIVLYMLSMREVPSVAPDGNDHAVSLPDDWEESCSDTLFCFSRPQCLSVLRVIADTDAASYLNPSSESDHSLKDQLGYFINKLELWDGVDEVAHWSAVDGEWMLDVTDISMFLARCFALRVRMWRLCSAELPNIAGSSEVIEYPNGIDLEPSLDEAGFFETFAPVFMHGTNSGHIVPAVRIGVSSFGSGTRVEASSSPRPATVPPGPPAKVESEVEPAARAEAETEHKEEDRPPSKRLRRKANQGGSSEPHKPLPILHEEHTGEVNELFSVALGNTRVAQHESGTRAHPPYVHDCTIIIQGAQLAYCMLDPYAEIQAAAKELNLPDLRKRAEFRKLALLKGRPYPWFCPLGVGKGKDRPQNNIVQEVAACLQHAGYRMPTEEELIAKGWWGSIVGVLHMTGTAEEGDPRWNALGRWTRDIGKWKAPNIFDDLSFTLEKSLTMENRPYGPSVKVGKTATGLLKQQCESIWMSKVCEVRASAVGPLCSAYPQPILSLPSAYPLILSHAAACLSLPSNPFPFSAGGGPAHLPHSLLSNPFLSPRCAAAACRQGDGKRSREVEPDQPQRPHHPARFDDATAAAFTARRVSAVFNIVKEDGYVAVTNPEARGCCHPFSHLGAMWPTLFKHGLDMNTEGDMKASSGFPRTHNGTIPSSDRALSGMLREKIKQRMEAARDKEADAAALLIHLQEEEGAELQRLRTAKYLKVRNSLHNRAHTHIRLHILAPMRVRTCLLLTYAHVSLLVVLADCINEPVRPVDGLD